MVGSAFHPWIPLAAEHFRTAANVAQVVTAAAALIALGGAWVQISVTRALARRRLVYDYLARFNQKEMLARTARFRDYWAANTWDDFEALSRRTRGDLVLIPNVIEEVAGMYNRRLLDRELAALNLGPLVERLWEESHSFIEGIQAERGDWVYFEWNSMQGDTRERRARGYRRIVRRWHLRSAMTFVAPATLIQRLRSRTSRGRRLVATLAELLIGSVLIAVLSAPSQRAYWLIAVLLVAALGFMSAKAM